MKLKGKVLISFNDKHDNLKRYEAEKDIYEAEKERYIELYDLGYVEEGKEVHIKQKNISKKEDEE